MMGGGLVVIGGRVCEGCDWWGDCGIGRRRGCVEVFCGEFGVFGVDGCGWLMAGWKGTGVFELGLDVEGGRLMVTGGDPLRR